MIRTRLAVTAFAAVLAVTGCGGGDDAAPDGIGSLGVSPLPADASSTLDVGSTTAANTSPASPATTLRPTATSQPVTTARPVTTPPTTSSATTVPAGGPPCELSVIIEQTQSAVDGVTPGSLRCAQEWASWTGYPDDPQAMDGYFAVAQWDGSAWELRNLGTAGICGDGGVPETLWPELDCVD